MNYKMLSDRSLHEAVTENFKREDQATYEVLCSLREVEKRKLFLKYPDCTSLFDYCVKIQKRSEGATSRRISAMRLMKDDPVIEEKFESGDLSLSNAVQIAKFSSHIGATPEQKRELVEKSLRMSQAKCKSVIAEMYPTEVSNLVDYKFTVEKKTEEKFRALKDMLAHQNPEGTDSALFALLVEKAHREEMKKRERKPETPTAAAAVKKNTPSESADHFNEVDGPKVRHDENRASTAAAAVKKNTPSESADHFNEVDGPKVRHDENRASTAAAAVKKNEHSESAAQFNEVDKAKDRDNESQTVPAAATVKRNEPSESAARSNGVNEKKIREDENRTVTAAAAVTPKNPRAYSQRVSTTRILYERANHHCEWPGCTSKYKLERDHIIPIAHGGLDTIENLRLLCRAHHAEASRQAGFQNNKQRAS